MKRPRKPAQPRAAGWRAKVGVTSSRTRFAKLDEEEEGSVRDGEERVHAPLHEPGDAHTTRSVDVDEELGGTRGGEHGAEGGGTVLQEEERTQGDDKEEDEATEKEERVATTET